MAGKTMQRRDVQIIIQQRHADGRWKTVGSAELSNRELNQIGLVLDGLFPSAFEAMPNAVQERVGRNIKNGESPHAAMN